MPSDRYMVKFAQIINWLMIGLIVLSATVVYIETKGTETIFDHAITLIPYGLGLAALHKNTKFFSKAIVFAFSVFFIFFDFVDFEFRRDGKPRGSHIHFYHAYIAECVLDLHADDQDEAQCGCDCCMSLSWMKII